MTAPSEVRAALERACDILEFRCLPEYCAKETDGMSAPDATTLRAYLAEFDLLEAVIAAAIGAFCGENDAGLERRLAIAVAALLEAEGKA